MELYALLQMFCDCVAGAKEEAAVQARLTFVSRLLQQTIDRKRLKNKAEYFFN